MERKNVRVAIWINPADTALNFKFWSPETDLVRMTSIDLSKDKPAEEVARDIKWAIEAGMNKLIREVLHPDECHCDWKSRDREKDELIGPKKGRSIHPFTGQMQDWEYNLYRCHKCGKEWLDAPLIA
jgi:hypothetical protein